MGLKSEIFFRLSAFTGEDLENEQRIRRREGLHFIHISSFDIAIRLRKKINIQTLIFFSYTYCKVFLGVDKTKREYTQAILNADKIR